MNAQRGELETLNPALICIDCDTQSREGNDEATIEEYAEAMRQGAQFPPVVVFLEHDEQGNEIYWCADGHHRVAAAIRAEIEEIDATVYKGSREDAALYSCGANQSHGLKRSPQDKRSAARRCMKLRPEWSDRKVAEHCGIDHKTVADERRRAQATGEIPQLGERVGKDGKARALPAKAAEPDPDETKGELVTRLLQLLERRGALAGAADQLSILRAKLEERGRIPEGAWREVVEAGRAAGFWEYKASEADSGQLVGEIWLLDEESGESSRPVVTEPKPAPAEPPLPTRAELVELLRVELERRALPGPRDIDAVVGIVQYKRRQLFPQPLIQEAIEAGRAEGLWGHDGKVIAGKLHGKIWPPGEERAAPFSFGTAVYELRKLLRDWEEQRKGEGFPLSMARSQLEERIGLKMGSGQWPSVLERGHKEGFWRLDGDHLWPATEAPGPASADPAWLRRAVHALLTVLARSPEPSMDPIAAWKAVEASLGEGEILAAVWARIFGLALDEELIERRQERMWLLEAGARWLAEADGDDPAAQGFLASLEEDPDDDEDEDDDDTDADDDETADEETEGQVDAPAPRGEAELLKEALEGASVGRKDGLVPMAKAREAFAYLLGVETVTDDRWTRAVRLAREAGLVHVVGGSLRLAPEQPPARPGLPNGERAALDAYWTPDSHARALVRWLDERVLLSRGAPEFILEPSVGGGAWLRAARDQWPEAKLRAIDLDPTAPGLKLADEPSVGDFLQADLLGCDVVLGNPPYSAELPAWVDASRAVAPVVAYLLRETVTGSLERLPWWQDRPPAWIVKVLPRPRWEGPGARASTDTSDTVLVVWVHGEHDTRYRWLDVREGA